MLSTKPNYFDANKNCNICFILASSGGDNSRARTSQLKIVSSILPMHLPGVCLAQFSLNNVHKRGLKHHHFLPMHLCAGHTQTAFILYILVSQKYQWLNMKRCCRRYHCGHIEYVAGLHASYSLVANGWLWSSLQLSSCSHRLSELFINIVYMLCDLGTCSVYI